MINYVRCSNSLNYATPIIMLLKVLKQCLKIKLKAILLKYKLWEVIG